MSNRKLAEIVVRTIEFFELVDDAQLDSHTALQYLEGILADLAEATPEEQEAGPPGSQRAAGLVPSTT